MLKKAIAQLNTGWESFHDSSKIYEYCETFLSLTSFTVVKMALCIVSLLKIQLQPTYPQNFPFKALQACIANLYAHCFYAIPHSKTLLAIKPLAI